MAGKNVIIIGSGLGGLSCGVILAKNGYSVTIVEKEHQIGGCLQCFKRHGVKFETGMHFIGSADEGQPLYRLLRYLDVLDGIELSRLDPTGYDVISIDDHRYKYANGRKAFIDQMSTYFPHQAGNISRYFDLIENVAGASSLHSLKLDGSDPAVSMEYQLRSINDVVDEIITDPMLAKVLVGNLPLYAPVFGKTPFSTHAFVTDFYNKSSFRIVGGSDRVAERLAELIARYDGRILTNSKVTKIVCDSSQAKGVVINDDTFLEADIIISDAHPLRTIELLGDTRLIRPAFRKRIKEMPQTIGGFSVYLEFKENSLPYMNSNFYRYNDGTPWNCEIYNEESWPKGYLYMHFCHEAHSRYAKTGVILSYMKMSEVEQWVGTKVGHRGADYEQFKKTRAEKLISSLEKEFPDIRQHIKRYYTSTPLTYLDYTGTEKGSMYGISKDISLGVAGRVPQRTRIPNVFQTGQNINSHGMLGVLVGSIVTCSELVPTHMIFKQIIDSNHGN